MSVQSCCGFIWYSIVLKVYIDYHPKLDHLIVILNGDPD